MIAFAQDSFTRQSARLILTAALADLQRRNDPVSGRLKLGLMSRSALTSVIIFASAVS